MRGLKLILTPRIFALMMYCIPLSAVAAPLMEDSSSRVEHGGKASQLLQQSGDAKVGQMMPFFSGWTISEGSGQAYSRTKALKEGRARYVVSICASWCKPCMEGLAKLSASRDRFDRTNTGLLILVADKSNKAREIYNRFGFNWAKVIVDEFQSFALKLAPESKKGGGSKGLNLPRTIIFDNEGKVIKIIGSEGPDYIEAIFVK